jgi:23S rRNA pseudouridine1911/1915/1917 synthase
MAKWTVALPGDLRSFLSSQLSISKNKAKSIIDSKNVWVNNKRVWIASHALKKQDIVEFNDVKQNNDTKKDHSLRYGKIIYEDDYIIAVNKPPLVLSDNEIHSQEQYLRDLRHDNRISAIHRLDKDTTGVILFAKNQDVREKFKELWNDKKVQKVYYAISHHEADFEVKTLSTEIDGKNAVSHIDTISKKNGYSLFKINIETGRKHQIRIHLASIRYPVAGDKEYGFKSADNELTKSIRRQMLHAFEISYQCPFTGRNIKINAPLYPDFIDLMNQIGLKNK